MANGNQENPGSVASGIVHPAEPGPEVKRLEVCIGRWIIKGHVAQHLELAYEAVTSQPVRNLDLHTERAEAHRPGYPGSWMIR
jgi:hypothetical protein